MPYASGLSLAKVTRFSFTGGCSQALLSVICRVAWSYSRLRRLEPNSFWFSMKSSSVPAELGFCGCGAGIALPRGALVLAEVLDQPSFLMDVLNPDMDFRNGPSRNTAISEVV